MHLCFHRIEVYHFYVLTSPSLSLLALWSVCMHVFFCPGFRSPYLLQGQKDSPMVSSLSFLYSSVFKIRGFTPSGFCSVFCVTSTQLYLSPRCASAPPLPPSTHTRPVAFGSWNHRHHALIFHTQKSLFLGSLFCSVGSSALYVSITAVFITAPLESLLIPQRPYVFLFLFEIEHIKDIFFFQMNFRINWSNS